MTDAQGDALCVQTPTLWLYEAPDARSRVSSQLLYGEHVRCLDARGDWLHIKADRDGYSGWASKTCFSSLIKAPTHVVCAPSALVYAEPDFHGAPLYWLPMNAQLTLKDASAGTAYLELGNGNFIAAKHTARESVVQDPVEIAKLFLGTPYAWGGRTITGIDCSGLIQQALWACGHGCPRDSGDQWTGLGKMLTKQETPEHGDLVFFPGHVGFYLEGGALLHSNARHMRCTIDPLEDVISQIGKDHPAPLTGFKRI